MTLEIFQIRIAGITCGKIIMELDFGVLFNSGAVVLGTVTGSITVLRGKNRDGRKRSCEHQRGKETSQKF